MDNWKPDEKVIKELEELLNEVEDPDAPIFGDSERTYSPKDILEEIKNGTPYGRQLHQHYLDLDKESGASE